MLIHIPDSRLSHVIHSFEVKAVSFNYSTYLSYARFTRPLMVTIVDIQREVVDLGWENISANKVLVLQT